MVLVLLEHLLMQIVENLREVLVYCVLTDILLGMMANVQMLIGSVNSITRQQEHVRAA
jgi:hypothetical protein